MNGLWQVVEAAATAKTKVLAEHSELVKTLTKAEDSSFTFWDSVTMQPVIYMNGLYEKQHKLVTEYILDRVTAAREPLHQLLRLIAMVSQSSHGFHEADLKLIRRQMSHTFGTEAAAVLTTLQQAGLVKQRAPAIGWRSGKPAWQQANAAFGLSGDPAEYGSGMLLVAKF